MQNTAEAIDYLQALLTIYVEQEDPFVSAIIKMIHQRLEGLKTCTS
ncbi:MAG TPA: hypothetical protein PLW83_05520 [Deltaproteobacteria bacterium]|nr:hypothetical protein [Deltaproteobacteria bacterium]